MRWASSEPASAQALKLLHVYIHFYVELINWFNAGNWHSPFFGETYKTRAFVAWPCVDMIRRALGMREHFAIGALCPHKWLDAIKVRALQRISIGQVKLLASGGPTAMVPAVRAKLHWLLADIVCRQQNAGVSAPNPICGKTQWVDSLSRLEVSIAITRRHRILATCDFRSKRAQPAHFLYQIQIQCLCNALAARCYTAIKSAGVNNRLHSLSILLSLSAALRASGTNASISFERCRCQRLPR